MHKNHAQIAVVAAVRAAVLQHSGGGVRGIAHVYKNLDQFGKKKLDANDLMIGLKDYKILLSKEEAALLVGAFDRIGDGTVTYDEFLEGIKGEMNATRKAIVMRAYAKMDNNKDGRVDMKDIRALYSARLDPRVISGRLTEDDVLREFLHVFQGVKANKNDVVTPDEWCDYYSSVSASVDLDELFVEIIKHAWKLDEYDVNYEKGWSNKQ